MVPRLLILLGLLLLPFPAIAQSLEGHWALRIDEATIFVFRLDRQADGTWSGAWKRPTEIASNGAVFQRMGGSEVVVAQQAGERPGEVQLVFAGPPGASGNDVLRFRLTSENQALLTYVGVPGDPYPLIRVRPDTQLGPFEVARIYDRDLAVVEAEYVPTEPEPEAEPEPEPVAELSEPDLIDAELADAEDASDEEPASVEVVAEAAEPAETVVEAADLVAPEPPARRIEPLALEPLDDPVAPPAAEVWQPLGLIDDATAAAAARAALNGDEPADAPEDAPEEVPAAAVEAAEPAAPEAEAEAPELPRIEADFLDD